MVEMTDLIRGIVEQRLPLDLLFDGTGEGGTGRLLGVRRVDDADGLAIEVTSEDAPREASVVRVRMMYDRLLYEFAVLIVRRVNDPHPVLLTRYPSEVHTVERRQHQRIGPLPAMRLRVALTVSGEWIPVELHNVSEGGAAFSSPAVGTFAVGHTVARLELTLDDGPPLVTSGTVRNVYTIRYPREVGPVYGVQWGRLTPEERTRLQHAIATPHRT